MNSSCKSLSLALLLFSPTQNSCSLFLSFLSFPLYSFSDTLDLLDLNLTCKCFDAIWYIMNMIWWTNERFIYEIISKMTLYHVQFELLYVAQMDAQIWILMPASNVRRRRFRSYLIIFIFEQVFSCKERVRTCKNM
jgi:hypothetical protein